MHRDHQGFLGNGKNIFTLDYDRLKHLSPHSWIKHLWAFCHQFDIQLDDLVTANVILRRANDRFIMAEVSKAEYNFTNTDLKHINRCRIYLRVTSQADITNGNGLKLRNGVMKGELTQHHRDYYLWPRQDRPGLSSWRIWRKAIKKCFLRGVELHVKATMQLGRWTDGERENWNWFFVTRTQRLFQRLPHRWRVFTRQGRGRPGQSPIYCYHNDSFSLPTNATRCTVHRDNRNQIHLSGFGREGPTINWNLPTPHTILDDVQVRGDANDILESIRQGRGKVVSDGSYLEEEDIGTASWILEGSKNNYVIGQHETPGDRQYQCSHRSEMFGLLGGILTTNALCEAHGITDGTITAKCDGEGTILIVQWLHAVTNNSRKHHDLIHSIKEALAVSPLTWTFEHIDGHQDDHMSYSQLDRWAQLNVIVDAAAKKKLTNILRHNTRKGHEICIPYTHCTVKWKGYKAYHSNVCSHLSKTLADDINKLRLRQYWEARKNIGELSAEHVDWKHLEKSSTSYKKGKWLAKFVSGICGVGSMLMLWKHQNHSSCPRCGEDNEDTQHVIQCGQPAAIDKWKGAIEDLRIWMENQDAAPDLSNAICKGLDNWKNGKPPTTRMYSFNRAIREAMVEQGGIGWDNLICGFATKKWHSIIINAFFNMLSTSLYHDF